MLGRQLKSKNLKIKEKGKEICLILLLSTWCFKPADEYRRQFGRKGVFSWNV